MVIVDAQRIGARIRMIRLAEGIDLIGLRLTRAVVSSGLNNARPTANVRDRHCGPPGHTAACRHDARPGWDARPADRQRATQGDVEALDAAADASNGLSAASEDQALSIRSRALHSLTVLGPAASPYRSGSTSWPPVTRTHRIG